MNDTPIVLRPLPQNPETGGLLKPFLLASVNWLDVRPALSEEAVDADDLLTGYVSGWGRTGDLATGAWSGTTLIGAAWTRLASDDWAGHGYVARGIPEMSLAVEPAHRGEGIATKLTSALIALARMSGHPSLSVSIEDGNEAALVLANRFGFAVVGRSGSADTLLLRL